MKIIIPLLLLGVILVSGCTGFPGVFGGDVIKVQTRSVEETPKDPIVVKDIRTIPTSPVLPDQEVVLSFVIENRDKLRPVRSVVIDLFNAPGFRNKEGKLCNSGIGVCRPSDESGVSCTANGICTVASLLPGEERLIQFFLFAPSRAQVANIETKSRLDFKVLYDFDSSMNFVIPAINREEVLRRQRESQAMNIIFDKSVSSGPVRIDVEPLGVKFILDNLETVLLFNIKNVGSGTIKNSEIAEYTEDYATDCFNRCMGTYGDAAYCQTIICAEATKGLLLMFPSELTVSTGGILEEIFDRQQLSEGGLKFTNKKPIQIFRDKSQTSLRFPVKLTQETYNLFKSTQIPFRSYEIKSKVFYTYELRNNVDVTINIFENV